MPTQRDFACPRSRLIIPYHISTTQQATVTIIITDHQTRIKVEIAIPDNISVKMNIATKLLLFLLHSILNLQTITASLTCTSYTSIIDIHAALQSSTNINICASSTPISWSVTNLTHLTPKLDALNKIYLNDGRNYKFNCIIASGQSTPPSEKRCIFDFTPSNDVTLSTSDTYGGFVLQNDKTTLSMNGFEFRNRVTKGSMFYTQSGSTLDIKNCVFRK